MTTAYSTAAPAARAASWTNPCPIGSHASTTLPAAQSANRANQPRSSSSGVDADTPIARANAQVWHVTHGHDPDERRHRDAEQSVSRDQHERRAYGHQTIGHRRDRQAPF